MIVIIEAISSPHDTYTPLALTLMLSPFFACFAWRYYFSPGLLAKKGHLVVREPYRTTWIPWSDISGIKWQKSILGYQLCLVNGAAHAGEKFYPRAFQKTRDGEAARTRLLADMEVMRDSSSGGSGDPLRHQRSSFAPEFASTAFFVLCLIVALTGQ
ncbi:hypothetical protein [Streptomyces sp. CB00455]|uniref:hypothetical protein n=1 Tax=Streptomyces sp. CB00455 TaxID=1703927 RepID=UPI0011611D43|nr:hypothetical protein [Streptomyces sp. CB00455]